MELNTASPGRPAPYGRACINCARAKCKCLVRNDGGSCERCHRMQKQCIPSATVRKRKSRASGSQTARLEQKLDGLVNLLKLTSRNNPDVENAAANWGNLTTISTTTTTPPDVPEVVSGIPGDSFRGSEIQPRSPLTPASSATSSYPYALPRDAEPTAEEAEYYFEMFRTQKLQYFPFTHFPDDMTAQQLRQERPFFWLCIMAISSTIVSQQLTLGRAIREIAGHEILVEGQRNLDMLMGLLCFVGWGQYQMHAGPLLSVFSHLCIALILDMELHKSTQKESPNPWCPAPSSIHKQVEVPRDRTMEHRRLALACYLLSSTSATFHQKVECLGWTPYLEQCLRTLEQTKEYPHDKQLVYQIRFQRLLEKTTSVCLQVRDLEPDASSPLAGLYIRALKAQLAELKRNIPSYLAGNDILQLQALSAEVAINELHLQCPHPVSLVSDSSLETIQCLYACLAAVKSWFDIFLKYDPMAYVGFSLSIWKQFVHKLFALYRLSALDDPAWDTELVRRTANLSHVMDQITSNLQQAGSSFRWKNDRPGQEDVFSRSIKVVGMFKTWFDSLPRLSRETAPEDQMQVMEDHQPLQEPFPFSTIFPSLEQTDLWTRDVLGLWDMYSGRTIHGLDMS